MPADVGGRAARRSGSTRPRSRPRSPPRPVALARPSDVASTRPSTPPTARSGPSMVPFGGWEMPLSYPDGTLAEHRACRERRGRLRRQPPRHRAGRGAGRLRPRSRRALTNDLAQDRRRAGRSTPTCSTSRRLGARRHHRVVGRRRALRRHAQRVEHRPGACDAIGGADVTAERGRHRRAGARGPAPAGSRRARGGRGRPLRASRRFDWQGVALRRRRAPATPARTASSARCPAEVAADVLATRCSAPASRPPGLGARDTLRLEAGPAAARPRARARASRRCRPASAGSSAGTRATSGARAPLEAEQERGVGPAPAGHRPSTGRQPPRTG